MSQFCVQCGPLRATLAPLNPPSDNPSLDLTRLLTTNDVPLESDIPFIRDIISEGRNRIGDLQTQMGTLEAEICRLRTIIAQLAQRRKESMEHIRQHCAIISPVRRVPPELICEILALTLLNNDVENEHSTRNPPWYLGQICRPWRHSALSFSPLWSSITVPSLLYSRQTGVMPTIEAQLLRTANAPLDIYWTGIHDVDPRVSDLVLRHCTRWRSLCLQPARRLFRDSGLLDWLLPLNGHLEQLQNFEVNNAARITAIPDIFSTAPNLRQVFLTGKNFESSPEIKIPWGQITHYRGTYSPRHQLKILAAAPNLLECAIGLTEFQNFDTRASPVVVLPHLRRLCVQTPDLLPNLTAPVLQELCGVSSTRQTIPLILSFIHCSSCTLQKLALMEFEMCPELITALQGLRSLTHLILKCSSDARGQAALFNAISISGGPSDVCPNLKSFEYGYRVRDLCPVDSFFAMIRSRFQPGSSSSCHLSRLRTFGDPRSFYSLPDALDIGMAKLRDEGFDAAILEHYEAQLLEKSLL
ncbi:hypothetical protein B0H13DRAFT_2459561 [Mycena leptocephala]|nr:hypothetical protein B0H13DRAFT_2459561 [Mycena leptocephala]